MNPPKSQFDPIVHGRIDTFTSPHPKGISYVLMCICLFTNFPIAIQIQDKFLSNSSLVSHSQCWK